MFKKRERVDLLLVAHSEECGFGVARNKGNRLKMATSDCIVHSNNSRLQLNAGKSV